MDSINDAREYGIDSVASIAFDKDGDGVLKHLPHFPKELPITGHLVKKVFPLAEKTGKSRAQSRNVKVNNLLFE